MTDMRIGLGHDRHRLVAGRVLVLGGIEIPHGTGPFGHSDGDVLLHALTDALLGALGLGDIGEWFPDDDPTWKDADSSRFVEAVRKELQARGWQIANVDATVFAERPKLSPFKEGIRSRVAELLQLEASQVNLKAKTGEAVGPVGREEAIEATAIVLITRSP